MLKHRKVIVITGTPGTGKSTISKLLADKLGGIHVGLGEVAIKKGFVTGFDEKRATWIADLPKLKAHVAEIVEEVRKTIVIEGHYAASVVPARYASIAIVLRCHPDELAERLSRSGMKKEKVTENVAAEILDICLCEAENAYGTDRICEVDTTGKSAEESVEEILAILSGKIRPSIGKADWLTRLDKEGRLKEFLGQ